MSGLTFGMARWLAGAALLLAGLCAQAGPAPTAHVFLVQNSGWMEPFYSDPASPYKALVTELALAVTDAGDPLVLAAFNQSLPGAPSPRALASLTTDNGTRARLQTALAGLQPATKPGAASLADTDLNEALGAAIHTALGGKSGLVWLFTNNRNSPNNDQATAARNREFYALIHEGSQISKAIAYPLKMPVQGARYSANGLMVYVFAIGEPGARALDRLLASGRIARIITEAPARLKPLDIDSVRLLPKKVSNAPGVDFSMGPAGMLRADVDESASAPAAQIDWQLENTIYPYTIASATLEARSLLGGEERPITLGSSKVDNLAPGASAPLSSTMQLPVARLPGKWSLQAVAAAGSAFVLPGSITLHLSDQHLVLSQRFRERMNSLFPGDPLPDIFTPPSQIHASQAVLPIEVRVHYGVAPLLAAIGAGAALLAALATAAHLARRVRRVAVTVDDEVRVMLARPGISLPIYDKGGVQLAQLKTTLFGHTLTDLRAGAQVRLGR